MALDTIMDGLPTADVTISGGAYRGASTAGGATWLCKHVHFTAQSARSCAEQHLRSAAKSAARVLPP